MNIYKQLKRLRLSFAIIILVIFSFIFLDIYHLVPEKFTQIMLSTQLIPSLFNFLKAGGILFSGFLIIGILSIIFGRLYCSVLCPLGIFMDVIIFIKKKYKKRRLKFKPIKALAIIPLSILGLSVLLLLIGNIQALSLLDPYSNFGRIITITLKPIIININNLIYDGMITFDNYTLQPIKASHTPIPVYVFVIFLLISIVFITLFKGRLFCTHICPVGTALGLLSRFSLFKVQINSSTCTSCGACQIKCKTGCISAVDKKVDHSRCIMCMNCLTTNCHVGGINLMIGKYKEPKLEMSKTNFSPDRRKALMMLGGLPLLGIAKPNNISKENILTPAEAQKRRIPISPPGSLSHMHLKDACTACYLCVNVCPSNVIKPSLAEYGLSGLALPQLTNVQGYCNLECTKCTEVCPTGALLPVSQEEKKTLQLGVAWFVRELCVVITDKTDCGACSEHCPTKAVNMVLEDGLFVPVVQESICIGCGACEFACPVRPQRAIFVEGNPIHELAEKPKLEKLEEVDMEEDFPF